MELSLRDFNNFNSAETGVCILKNNIPRFKFWIVPEEAKGMAVRINNILRAILPGQVLLSDGQNFDIMQYDAFKTCAVAITPPGSTVKENPREDASEEDDRESMVVNLIKAMEAVGEATVKAEEALEAAIAMDEFAEMVSVIDTEDLDGSIFSCAESAEEEEELNALYTEDPQACYEKLQKIMTEKGMELAGTLGSKEIYIA